MHLLGCWARPLTPSPTLSLRFHYSSLRTEFRRILRLLKDHFPWPGFDPFIWLKAINNPNDFTVCWSESVLRTHDLVFPVISPYPSFHSSIRLSIIHPSIHPLIQSLQHFHFFHLASFPATRVSLRERKSFAHFPPARCFMGSFEDRVAPINSRKWCFIVSMDVLQGEECTIATDCDGLSTEWWMEGWNKQRSACSLCLFRFIFRFCCCCSCCCCCCCWCCCCCCCWWWWCYWMIQ